MADMKFGVNLFPNANNTYELGSSTLKWKNIYGPLKGNADTATDADKLDGYHETSFLRARDGESGSGGTSHIDTLWNQIGIKQLNNALPQGMADSATYTWGAVVSLPSTESRFDLWYNHQTSSNGNGLRYRTGWNNDKRAWATIIDSNNIGSQSVNYATSSGSSTNATYLANNKGATNVTIATGTWQPKTSAADSNGNGGYKYVWQQQWKTSDLKYTPSGGTQATNTDTADLAIWLEGSKTGNALTANMNIDGKIYALGGFEGNLSGNATTASRANITTTAKAIARYSNTTGAFANSIVLLQDNGRIDAVAGNGIGIKIGASNITSASTTNGEIVLQGGHLRFGDAAWDYNKWAGLKYNATNKIISLGVADGTIFTANAAQTGGTIDTPGVSKLRVGYHTNAISSAVYAPTAGLEIVAGAGGNTNSTAIGFHNPGVSSGVFGYYQINANSGAYKLLQDDNKWFNLIGGTIAQDSTSSWSPGTTVVGKDEADKIIIGNLQSTIKGAVIGGHNSALSAWAPLNISGTEVHIWKNEVRVGKFVDGCMSLFPLNSNYREGLRIHSSGSWSDILLCGNDNTGDSGTSANSWFVGNNNGNFYISRNGSSSSSSAILSCVNNVWSINGTVNTSISGNAATATSANYVNLYESRSTTTTLNKAANYIGAGKMFHLVASSSTSATDNGKTPSDANILQMNWDNNGGYDGQLGISTSDSRLYVRSRPSEKTAWREAATIVGATATGSATNPVYVSDKGYVTACTYSLNATVPANAKFTDTTYSSLKNPYSLTINSNKASTSVSYDGSSAKTISGDDLFSLTSITKSITITRAWKDTGISSTDLETGSYIVQAYIHSTGSGTLNSWYEYYTGVMSWYSSNTNSTNYDEILLHKAGHAPNGNHIYLRTLRGASGVLKLQIAATVDTTTAASVVFKFRKMI